MEQQKQPNLDINPFTLAFRSPAVEGEFLGEVAKRRWPVLIFAFSFDVCCFIFRFTAKLSSSGVGEEGGVRPFEVVREMGHQLANMAMLYVLIGLLNKRARKAGNNAARQEEVLLSICMGLAICNLLASLRADNAQDYVFLSYFLICTSTFLKIRWWVGTGLLATPTVAVQLWYPSSPAPSAILPHDAVVHIVVAWAVGGLMAYLSDWYRRQMYVNARLASAAHDKEMQEATARIQAQRELAAAQAQAAQRALTVAREKAAHEAKSEFMSLMCHEVRTPLNGCLASAEMLLETPLKDEQRELANTIRVSGSILLSTVSNFLDFFKMEAGKRLDIVRSEVVLGDLVRDVHCIIEAMIPRGGGVDLQQPQLLDVPELVFCDPDRLRGVLLNLYTNAAKFTKAGHIVLRVTCCASDATPPVPAGYSAIMLQPSYQPSSCSNRSMDIVSQVVMDHHGSSSSSVPATPHCSMDGANGTAAQQQQQQQQQQQAADAASCKADDASNNASTSSSSASKGGPYDVHARSTAGVQQQQQGAPAGAAAAPAGDAGGAHACPGDAAPPAAAGGAAPGGPGPARGSGSIGDTPCWLLFEVEDTGVGITRDGLASLFREYVQGTEAEMCKPRTRGGTGLGLSICSKQVGVLGGVIGAHSCRGHGSTFWFKIPAYVRTSHAPAAAGAAPSQAQQPTAASAPGQTVEAPAQLAGREAVGSCKQQPADAGVPPVQLQLQHAAGVAQAGGGGGGSAAVAQAEPATQLNSSVLLTSLYQSTAASSSSISSSRAAKPPRQQAAGSSAAASTAAAAAAAGSCSSSQPSSQAAAPARGVPQPGLPAAAAAAAIGAAAAAAPPGPAAVGSAAASSGAAASGSSSSVPRSRQLSLDGQPGPALDTQALVGRRVLLAEDNLINQTVARKMLSSLGMHVEVAANGLEAVTAVQRAGQHSTAAAADGGSMQVEQQPQQFSIVLMDMAMPVMGGVEATRAIRAAGHDLPIVAMTANASDRDRDECADGGMNGFLSKPVLRDQLARAMLAAIQEYEGSAAAAAAAGAAGGASATKQTAAE